MIIKSQNLSSFFLILGQSRSQIRNRYFQGRLRGARAAPNIKRLRIPDEKQLRNFKY